MSAAEEFGDDDFGEADPGFADFGEIDPRVDQSLAIADHVTLARLLVADLGGADVLVHDEMHTWCCEASGLYTRVDDCAKSRIVQGYSGRPTGKNGKPLKIKASDVSGTIKLAHDQIAQPGFFAGAPTGITFTNGFLSVTKDGAKLEPLTKQHRARAGYDFAYEPRACPKRYLAFLEQLFRDDEDRLEKENFSQEFFGACLTGIATDFQIAVVAIGKGDNGKSAKAKIMQGCMPAGTVTAIPPQEWGNEYRRAMFVGIRLNAPGELPERDIIDSEPFKAIVAGDLIVGRAIREAPVMFKPIAGHYFPANELPGTADQTEGFWRRLVALTYNRSFTNDPTRDPHLAATILAEERPQIVSWLVDGAVRLLQAGAYTIPPSHHAAIAAWRKNADQVALFVDATMRPLRQDEPDAWGASATDLYASYRRWCEANGHRPMASNKFGSRLRSLRHVPQHTSKGSRYPLAFRTAAERDGHDEPVTNCRQLKAV